MTEQRVDATGRPLSDPTSNVTALVAAAMLRQDDLRKESERRQDDLRLADREHARELRIIETARLDAIRNVDNVAVQRAAEVSAAQAQTLANTLAQTAEAMRTQVAAAATVTATALDAKIAPLQSAISDLQRFQFEAMGQKTQVVETRASSGNVGLWIGVGVVAVIGVLSTLIGIAGLVATLGK